MMLKLLLIEPKVKMQLEYSDYLTYILHDTCLLTFFLLLRDSLSKLNSMNCRRIKQ